VILSTDKGGQIDFSVFSYGPNKAFLIPDSCTTTARSGSYIRADFTEDTTENYYNDACLSYFQTI